MGIRDDHELAVTRRKLQLLEERVAALKRETDGESYSRVLTRRSLVSMVNQLREEIVRYTSRTGAQTK